MLKSFLNQLTISVDLYRQNSVRRNFYVLHLFSNEFFLDTVGRPGAGPRRTKIQGLSLLHARTNPKKYNHGIFERESPTYDYCDLKRHVLMRKSIWSNSFYSMPRYDVQTIVK